MDKAIWITWYDIDAGGREAYLAWLHEAYLPQLVRRPGILWAAHYGSVPKDARRAAARESAVIRTKDSSVPTGSQYIQLVGAEHAHVFGNPSPSELHAGLPDRDRNMLKQRTGERVNIMAEAGRVEGPAARPARQEMPPTPCIQLGSFNCALDHEEEVLAWYTKWRMPAMAGTPGCVRFRTLASVSGWAKHAVMYEFVSLAARNEHFVTHEDARPEMKALSDRMVGHLTHAPGSANVAVRTWPPIQKSEG
jgi:hypothetical protein